MANQVYSKFYELPRGQAEGPLTDGCLVLEGGALRGLYTAGVLDCLMLNGLNFNCVIGTSAGSLTGLNYVAGAIGRSARSNLAFRHDSRYIGVNATMANRGVFGFKFLIEDYDNLDPLNMDALNNPERRFLCCVTNCNTGEPEYFEKGKCEDIFKACVASSSMPFISSMVEMGGQLYLDGGCTCKVPYKWALKQDFNKIVVVRTRDINYRKKVKDNSLQNKLIYHKYPKFVEALDSMNLVYNNDCDEMEQLEKEGRIFVIRPLKPVTVSRLEDDVEKLGELYQSGYSDCENSLEALREYLNK